MIINSVSVLKELNLRYTLKTKRVGTRPFGLAVSFIALTAICKISSLLRFSSLSLSLRILYKRHKGAWYFSTLLMLL
jgi:hypothetical protein